MRATRRVALVLAVLVVLGCAGCGKNPPRASIPGPATQETGTPTSQTAATDYSDPARWYSAPTSPDNPVMANLLAAYMKENPDVYVVKLNHYPSQRKRSQGMADVGDGVRVAWRGHRAWRY